jgi:hypothetical protein
MGQSDFADWWYEDYGDRRMQRKLEQELETAYVYQARAASALRSQMAQVSGTLEQRIDRLAKAFDAFVELSDIRSELAVFEDEISLRNAAKRLLRTLARDGADPSVLPRELPRCPGYWLQPALGSLVAAIAGDDAAAAEGLIGAQELDATRAAVFLVASYALAGQAHRAAPLLPAALGSPGEEVTYAQRALWRACAHDALGEPGQAAIRDWVTRFVGGLGEAVITAQQASWTAEADRALGAAAITESVTRALPAVLGGRMQRPTTAHAPLVYPLASARKLAALRVLVEEARTGEQAVPAGQRPAERGTAERGPAGPAPAGPGPAEPPTLLPVLGALAASLAEEGSPEEIALRQRERELRKVIDTRATTVRPSWDDREGKALDLLKADAFGADLKLRRLALVAGADWTNRTASRYAEGAREAIPDEFQVNLGRHRITVTTAGGVNLGNANAEIEEYIEAEAGAGKLFHRKQVAEDVAREQEQLARQARQAADDLAARAAETAAGARQAAADRDAVAAALRG